MNRESNHKMQWNVLARSWEKWEALLLGPRTDLHHAMIQLAGIEDHSRVLDFATGVGEPGLTAALKARSGEIYGADISAPMLSIASSRRDRLGVTNFFPLELTSAALPFPEASLDAVLCCFGLEFVPNPAATLSEFQRVLKRGGRVVINVWGPKKDNPFVSIPAETSEEFASKAGESAAEPGYDLFRFDTPERLLDLLVKAGFETVRSQEFNGQFCFDHIDEYWELKRDTAVVMAKVLSKLGAEEQILFQKKFYSLCMAFSDGMEKLVLPYRTFMVTASSQRL